MLTADLVDARKSKGELRLSPIAPDVRARALDLARTYVSIAKAHLGRTRGELEDALDPVARGNARDRRLAAGLRKLLDDRSTFEAGLEDAEALRRDVFLRAAAERRALEDDGTFEPRALLATIAAERATTIEAIEASLYGDLRDAHRLVTIEALTPEMLVDAWELARPQAILLRAVRVVVELEHATAASLRALLRKLKFLQLLHVAHKTEKGHRLEIDGPFSIFESATKYGLRLAMLVPALRECERFTLRAEVRWGEAREPLVFTMEGGTARGAIEESPLTDEVAALLASIRALDPPFRVSPSPTILELPGVGLCVPDLVFETLLGKKKRAYVEVMGYWSRDAVFKRIELAERGLPSPILFCVSERLRVSEALLDDVPTAALYVYKGKMSAKTVIERIAALLDAP